MKITKKIMARSLKISFLVLVASALAACSDQQDVTPAESSSAINLYQSQPLPTWQVVIQDQDVSQVLEGDTAALPDDKVTLRKSAASATNDALTVQWHDAWGATLSLQNGAPLDLREYLERGVLSLDINVIELAKGGLSLRVNCGENCERTRPFTEQGFAMMGKGWQSVRIPLSCFRQDGDDFSAVPQPFALAFSGQGEVAIANIALHKNMHGNVSCPDYSSLSITPAMLTEFWAREWWEPRHQEKLQRAQEGDVDLIMLGDSITHGWEKEGKATWDEYYAERNAYNIGFSGDRTENVLWRLQHGEVDGLNPKAVVLMIGTNNTGHRMEKPEYTAKGIKAILDELRTRLPEAKILMLAVFPREESPDAPMRKINNEVNSIIATYADNKHIHFLDINHVFLDDNGNLPRDIMPDLLHPNEKGYELWAEAMESKLKELLGE